MKRIISLLLSISLISLVFAAPAEALSFDKNSSNVIHNVENFDANEIEPENPDDPGYEVHDATFDLYATYSGSSGSNYYYSVGAYVYGSSRSDRVYGNYSVKNTSGTTTYCSGSYDSYHSAAYDFSAELTSACYIPSSVSAVRITLSGTYIRFLSGGSQSFSAVSKNVGLN